MTLCMQPPAAVADAVAAAAAAAAVVRAGGRTTQPIHFRAIGAAEAADNAATLRRGMPHTDACAQPRLQAGRRIT